MDRVNKEFELDFELSQLMNEIRGNIGQISNVYKGRLRSLLLKTDVDEADWDNFKLLHNFLMSKIDDGVLTYSERLHELMIDNHRYRDYFRLEQKNGDKPLIFPFMFKPLGLMKFDVFSELLGERVEDLMFSLPEHIDTLDKTQSVHDSFRALRHEDGDFSVHLQSYVFKRIAEKLNEKKPVYFNQPKRPYDPKGPLWLSQGLRTEKSVDSIIDCLISNFILLEDLVKDEDHLNDPYDLFDEQINAPTQRLMRTMRHSIACYIEDVFECDVIDQYKINLAVLITHPGIISESQERKFIDSLKSINALEDEVFNDYMENHNGGGAKQDIWEAVRQLNKTSVLKGSNAIEILDLLIQATSRIVGLLKTAHADVAEEMLEVVLDLKEDDIFSNYEAIVRFLEYAGKHHAFGRVVDHLKNKDVKTGFIICDIINKHESINCDEIDLSEMIEKFMFRLAEKYINSDYAWVKESGVLEIDIVQQYACYEHFKDKIDFAQTWPLKKHLEMAYRPDPKSETEAFIYRIIYNQMGIQLASMHTVSDFEREIKRLEENFNLPRHFMEGLLFNGRHVPRGYRALYRDLKASGGGLEKPLSFQPDVTGMDIYYLFQGKKLKA